jgi:hypothetical protein
MAVGPNTVPLGDGSTPIHSAVRAGHGYALLHAMTLLGASLSARNDYGLAPLHVAAGLGHARTVAALLQLGVPVDELDGNGNAALPYAVRFAHADAVQTLLQLGSPSIATMEQAVETGRVEVNQIRQEAAEAVEGESMMAETAARALRVLDTMEMVLASLGSR